MARLNRLVACGLISALAACATSRPEGEVCRGICDAAPAGPTALTRETAPAAESPPPPPSAADALAAMAGGDLGAALQSLFRQKADAVPRVFPERALGDLPGPEDGRLQMLALSAGGPYGAFGAGFLNGWSTQTAPGRARPAAFDVVTGVSAGALLATQAFLGPAEDEALARQYTEIATADILRRRPLLAALFGDALFDTKPLRATLERSVTPALLDRIAAATAVDPETGLPTRFLLVLAGNIDSGRPRIFDLGAIAREREDPTRVERYVDALMAPAAIPVAFPPVFVAGDMHADGGTRLGLFFVRYMELQRARAGGADLPPPALDIIVNGATELPPLCTPNTLVGVGRRALGVVLDQSGLDSLYRTVAEAEKEGIEVRYITADGADCPPPEDPADPFAPAFLRCLFDHGRDLARDSADPWRTGLEDFPGAELSLPTSRARSRACSPG
jgi:hypothetical protein